MQTRVQHPSVLEYVHAAQFAEDSGEVSCTSPHWRGPNPVGKFSDYPKLIAPPERRTMVMRCLLHGNGRQCYLMRSRPKGFKDDFMLRWLFSGLVMASDLATDAVVAQQAAQEHKDLAKAMLLVDAGHG